MFPELFSLGPITVYSYGAMLATAFLVGAWLFRGELRRWDLPEELADHVAIAAMFGGIVGAKLYFVLLEAPEDFAAAPLATLFSGAGLTYYGGLGGAILAIWFVLRRAHVPFVKATDLLGPILILGYGFGRAGCFLSGDGDYGPPTELPWGMSFPEGTVPTVLNVHPTPLYEIALSWAGFAALWFLLRKKPWPRGMMTGLTFVVLGVERVVTEFWRFDSGVYAMNAYSSLGFSDAEVQRNAFALAVAAHYSYAGFSLAQIISVGWVIAGVTIILLRRKTVPELPPDSGTAPNDPRSVLKTRN